MRCPNITCRSSEIESLRKYKAEDSDANRVKYKGMNLDRRRYMCNGCKKSFYTIELMEVDFEQHYQINPTTDVKGRVR